MINHTIDIRNMNIAMQSVLIENPVVNPLSIHSINEKIQRRALLFENQMNEIISSFEGNLTTYKSTASQLNKSCYNCQHFRIGNDMLKGTCERKTYPTHSVSGIGTCDDFSTVLSHA